MSQEDQTGVEAHDLRNKELSPAASSEHNSDHLHKKRINGIKGIMNNPYVFFTAIFASIGGILFGCKYTTKCTPLSIFGSY
jgi:hypothetical protein